MMKFRSITLSILLITALTSCASRNGSVEKKQDDTSLNTSKELLKAPTFSYASLEGNKNISPDDFKGKYLLIDFWASWCHPCNEAIPTLKEAYSQYSAKGFEILSVSLDESEQDWKSKIQEEEIKWNNVITPDKGKEVSGLYEFYSIPYFVLLDKEGNIINKGFSIDELLEILKSTIN